eukprot:CAMPEP_0172726824 /NCGR_PEP_ID=MMETSP1074-20121228/91333_1 /TAXON_ID=2916 /ORGANISM="Ceratium fusus, Strain PA161109" /LENGTH=110 /DNA_ID=CAMNT_0013553919 /DNA_START=374 /DNA_END=703 /DNA_ORIENTATION=-
MTNQQLLVAATRSEECAEGVDCTGKPRASHHCIGDPQHCTCVICCRGEIRECRAMPSRRHGLTPQCKCNHHFDLGGAHRLSCAKRKSKQPHQGRASEFTVPPNVHALSLS